MKNQVISLGKALVRELGVEQGVDTLSKWMAHYIAEQITTAENANGDAKAAAEQRCFETVLELWQHQSSFPSGRRPFKNFEPIFRALERMDPASPRLLFYESFFHETKENKDTEAPAQDVRSWINIALEVEGAARDLIEFALRQAARNAADEKTKAWIKSAMNLPSSDDLSVVIRLIQDDKDEDALGQLRTDQKKNLRSKIEKLDALIKASKLRRGTLHKEIREITKDKKPKEIRR